MLAWLSAVVQHFFVVATGILKGIGEDGHSVKGFIGVDASGKGKDGRCEPGAVEGDRAEGVADDFTK